MGWTVPHPLAFHGVPGTSRGPEHWWPESEQALTQPSARPCLSLFTCSQGPSDCPRAPCRLPPLWVQFRTFFCGGGTSLWSTLGLPSCELSVKLSDSQNLRLFRGNKVESLSGAICKAPRY